MMTIQHEKAENVVNMAEELHGALEEVVGYSRDCGSLKLLSEVYEVIKQGVINVDEILRRLKIWDEEN